MMFSNVFVTNQEDLAAILIGKDPIGIDLKNLLELKFLKTLFRGSIVEPMQVAISAKAIPTPNLSEKLWMQKFVLV